MAATAEVVVRKRRLIDERIDMSVKAPPNGGSDPDPEEAAPEKQSPGGE